MKITSGLLKNKISDLALTKFCGAAPGSAPELAPSASATALAIFFSGAAPAPSARGFFSLAQRQRQRLVLALAPRAPAPRPCQIDSMQCFQLLAG